jgi:hypothetical protein
MFVVHVVIAATFVELRIAVRPPASRTNNSYLVSCPSGAVILKQTLNNVEHSMEEVMGRQDYDHER